MKEHIISERIRLLFSQGRFKEAQTFLEEYLVNHPDDQEAKYFYAYTLFRDGQHGKSRQLTDELLAEDPEALHILGLSIDIDLDDNKAERAESKAELLLELDPESSDSYLTMAQVKLVQRNYDRALDFVNQALEIEPEDMDALNLKIYIDSLLGNDSVHETIGEALELDAENPSAIANHGFQLLREGKTKEALERFKYALSLDPNNRLARAGMQEALKSRFLIYRMFFKYKEFAARLTAGGSWVFIIGIYVAYRILNSFSDTYPALVPVVYGIAGLFLLTWIIDPLINAYLLTNKYGRVLLDEDDTLMAKLCSAAFVIVLGAGGYAIGFNSDLATFIAIMAALMMIPLGTFLNPVNPRNRKIMKAYTIGLAIAAVLSIFSIGTIFTVFIGGIFIYQWVINGMMIKENSRVMD